MIIFYNKRVKIDGKLVYDEEFFKAGLWRFCDLFESNGTLIPFNVWETRGIAKSKYIVWRALISNMRKMQIKVYNTNVSIPNKTILLPTNDIIDVQNSSSKEVYTKIVKLRIEKPTALSSYSTLFPSLHDKEIENMFILPRLCTTDTVFKEFQYKILHKYLPTNNLLYKMKKIDSRKCNFCNLYNENINHLFYECICAKELWLKVQKLLAEVDDRVEYLTCKDVILGFQLGNICSQNLLINNVILHGKVYLWKCKLLNKLPSYASFKEFIEYRKVYEKCLETVGQI